MGMILKLKEFFNQSFWQITKPGFSKLKCIEEKEHTPFVDIKDSIYDPDTIRLFHRNNNAKQYERLFLLKGSCILEPSLSYAIVGFNKIAAPSAFFYYLKPSTTTYLKFKLLNRGRKISLHSAILFDGVLGTNYFHFFADVINKLWLLEHNDSVPTLPLIIGKKVFETPYFKYLYENTDLKYRNWIVQESNDFIECRELYLLNPDPYNKLYWEKSIKLVEKLRSKDLPFRRLFLDRPVKYSRGLTNMSSLIPVIERFGFEIVNPGILSFEEQVRLFSEASIIAGVHGASFTNMMFADPKQLRVLEIMPLDRTSGQLYWLAATLGVAYYDCQIGSALVDSNFTVPLDKFEEAMGRIISFSP